MLESFKTFDKETAFQRSVINIIVTTNTLPL